MKTLFTFIILSISSLTFACADLKNKPAYLSGRVECGTLFHRIHDPVFTVNGKKYAFGMRLGDMSGECPDSNRRCFPASDNIKKRGNAICKAFGFGKYGMTKDYGGFKRKPDFMVSLERNSRGVFAPKVVSINHSRGDYAWAKTILCIPNYQKK